MASRPKQFLTLAALSAAMLAASAAQAAPPHDRHASARHGGQGAHVSHPRRDDDRYYVWAEVVDVDPIVRTSWVDEPVEVCRDVRDERRWRDRPDRHDRYDDRYETRHRRDADPGAVIVGGVLGGLLGNQFGGGNGKKALTAVGAVLGASIAAEASRGGGRHDDRRWRDDRHHDAPVRRCDVRYESRRVEHVDGYEVTYRYGGRRFTKVVDEHPGDRLRVRVDVSPA
jgi:uncharacterized protein YcfJ